MTTATLTITYEDTGAKQRELTKRIRRYNALVRSGVKGDEYEALRAEMIKLGQVKE